MRSFHLGIVRGLEKFSVCERRIMNGQQLTAQKGYMVYLTREKSSPRNYDSWLCGGAIVSSWYILTSAACVEDVQNMYAVAGYDKYVKESDLDTNPCTKHMKRRIVYTCLPEAYGLVFDKLEQWSKLDIALVKVDQKYKFKDRSYIQYCAYLPNKINVNFDIKYEEAGRKAIMLGWGHSLKWREIDDKTDYNQNTLRYASTTIFSKHDCKQYFDKPDLSDLIDNFMICTYKPGNIDDKGQVKRNRRKLNLNETFGTSDVRDGCGLPKIGMVGVLWGRLSSSSGWQKAENNNNNLKGAVEKIGTNVSQCHDEKPSSLRMFNVTRRQGICQNDHGGPLVSWVEGAEYVIGVASVFRINSKSECMGPNLFTSTARNKIFIDCVLNEKNILRRNSICDKPASEKGFNMIERNVSWIDHLDGSDENERIHKRPQIPISNYRG
ncbi:uncharacterized protein LOC126778203 isoform X2 [Nymphalis io]|uniref:uncharacterized protein LOC126778203 isoform X2 n=1 Tax=Inachis io TaxID=171585 RepID=UPI0021693181|nr:uncharacterized protein LOC126778203 isoform X2 [Nymphalis io]